VMKMDPVAGGLRSEKSPCLQSKTMDSSPLPAVCAPSRLASASAATARHQQHFQSCMPATASCCASAGRSATAADSQIAAYAGGPAPLTHRQSLVSGKQSQESRQ
jgi:hypothetical protein